MDTQPLPSQEGKKKEEENRRKKKRRERRGKRRRKGGRELQLNLDSKIDLSQILCKNINRQIKIIPQEKNCEFYVF